MINVKVVAGLHNIVLASDTDISEKTISWCKVTNEHIQTYCHKQDLYLGNMNSPDVVNCTNVTCANPVHLEEINVWCHDLVLPELRWTFTPGW
jgi:hypothetical protein